MIECFRELLPEGHVAGFGDFKNFTRQEALREKSKLVQKRELGRIATLHETGGDFLKQNRCGIARFERKTHLGVFDGCAVGAVGHRERRARLSTGLAASSADVFQESQGIGGGWRFGKSNSWTCAPLVIGSAGEDFLPWLGMRWRNARAGVENLDLSRSQRAEDLTRGLAKQSTITAIDRLEMPEEEYELLQMQLSELAIHTVKGMSNRVGDVLRKKILLQVVDTFPRLLDIAVLGLRDTPNQKMHAAFVLWEDRGNLLADDHIRQVGDFQATIDGVLIRERHEAHARRTEHAMEFKWVRGTGWKIQTPQNPIRRPITMAGVDVQIGACCGTTHSCPRMMASHC